MNETSNSENVTQQITLADLSLAREFSLVFTGRESAYGEFVPDGKTDAKGKITGSVRTVAAPVTEDLYLQHINGTRGLGIVPIKENNNVRFAVIDIDIYNTEVQKRTLSLLYAMSMPLVPFKSKSGGLHLYCFFREQLSASRVVDAMNIFKSYLLLDDDTEVFPKQTKIAPTDKGNWINLPYFGGAKNKGIACMLDENYEPIVDLRQALPIIQSAAITKKDLEEYFETLPLQDAPPCLQHIYLTGAVKGHRNDYLFSLGRYLKTKFGDEFETKLLEADQRLENPIGAGELYKTVIPSMKKKDYTYACSKDPMASFCNRKLCAKRKYGMGSKEVSNLSFGEFRQILTDPPTYEWDVEDKILQFDNASALMDQQAFCRQCIDKLLLFPARLNQNAWTDIVNNALEHAKKVEVNPDEDISPGALLMSYVAEFMCTRRVATSRRGVLRGLAFRDSSDGFSRYVFSIRALVDFLVDQRQVRPAALAELKAKMVAHGGKAIKYFVDDGHPDVVLWSLPISSVENINKQKGDIPDIEKDEFLAKDFQS